MTSAFASTSDFILPEGYEQVQVSQASDLTNYVGSDQNVAFMVDYTSGGIKISSLDAPIQPDRASSIYYGSAGIKPASLIYDNALVRLYYVDSQQSLSWKKFDVISFENNWWQSQNNYCWGGVICGYSSQIDFSENRTVKFIGNGTYMNDDSVSCWGGAIYTSSGKLSLNNNEEVIAQQNHATALSTQYSPYAHGGFISSGGDMEIHSNKKVDISGNSVNADGKGWYAYARGGAIYGEKSLSVDGNGAVVFSDNSAFASCGSYDWANAYGGAIMIRSGTFCNNESITFENNVALASSDYATNAYGGAISTSFANYDGAISFRNNGDITFRNNMAKSMCAWAYGGAIDASSLELIGNGNVLFEKNSLVNSYGVVLNSINAEQLSISTPESKNVTFRDSVHASSNVILNADYVNAEGETVSATGSIILDGSFAAEHVEAIKGSAATHTELRESRTHLFGDTELCNGALHIKGNARLDANTFESGAGSTLVVNSGNMRGGAADINRLHVEGGDINYVNLGYYGTVGEIVFSNLELGTTLKLEGSDLMGGFTIHIADENLAEGSYKLLTLAHGSSLHGFGNQISLTGIDAEKASLVWNDGSLYLNYGERDVVQGNNQVLPSDHVVVNTAADILNVKTLGSQKFVLNQDVEINSGEQIYADWAPLYEFTSKNSAAKAALTVKNVEGTAILCPEGSQQLILHGLRALNFEDNGTAIESGNVIISDIGSVYFKNSLVDIYGFSDFSASDNGTVIFEATAGRNQRGLSGGQDVSLELSRNNKLIFRNFHTSNSYGGGAIYASSGSEILLKGNKVVQFENNSSDGPGGAICGESYGVYYKHTQIKDNDTVLFSGNTAAYGGGAICDVLVMSGNGELTFTGNKASYGGALYAPGALNGNSGIWLEQNESISFIGNAATTRGGAIANGDGSVIIRNNESVVFAKNYEYSGDSYQLRSIYFTGISDRYPSALNALNLSCAADGIIEFQDSIYVDAEKTVVNLNADYTNRVNEKVKQTGDILFTGAYTEAHLKEVKGGVAGTAEEVRDSRTSEVYTLANLYGGRLRVEDGAVYKGHGITVHEGSEATVRVKDAELNHVGYDLTFNSGTALEVSGESTIRGQVNLQEGSVFKLELGAVLCLHETAGADVANLSVSGTALVSGTSTLNASLTLLDGSTLDMVNLDVGAVTLNGALTFGGQVTIGENLLALLEDIKGQTEGMVLFTGIDSLTLPDVAITTASARLWAGSVFSNLPGTQGYFLDYKADTGTLSIVYIPEPATASLSLLALAALAARRRRR